VPDIDVFLRLIRIDLRKGDFSDPTAYSNEDIAAIIRECNAVSNKLAPSHQRIRFDVSFDALYLKSIEIRSYYSGTSRKYEQETGFDMGIIGRMLR